VRSLTVCLIYSWLFCYQLPMLSLGCQVMLGASSQDGAVAALLVGDCGIKAMSSSRALAIGSGVVAVQSKSMMSPTIIHDCAIIGCDVGHRIGLLAAAVSGALAVAAVWELW